MISKSIVGLSIPDPCKETAIVLRDLGFMKRAQVSEIVESNMAKIHDSIKAEVIKIVVDMFEGYV